MIGVSMAKAKILVVDDEKNILEAVTYNLEKEGWVVVTAPDGARALEAARAQLPDLILLDWMIPEMSGLEVCRTLKRDATTRHIPIIMLTVKSDETDKVLGLEMGADDYVTKPFGAEELLARIRVALRRTDGTPATSGPIVRGSLVIDRERFRVVRDGEEVRLTPKEFDLLTYLAQHPGRVLTHRAILKAIWGLHAVDQPEHLRVLVGSLRKKIEPDPSNPRYILTEPWVGYRFADMDAST